MRRAGCLVFMLALLAVFPGRPEAAGLRVGPADGISRP